MLKTHFSPEGLRPGAAFAHLAVLALSVFASQIQLSQRESQEHCRKGAQQKSIAHFCAMLFSGGDYRDRTGDLLHAMQALSRTVSKHTPTRKCGDRLNIALIRSIHQKGSQLHPASRNHAPPTRQFYHPIFKCVNGFCSERRSFTRKVFSDSLLSAILILHIKVALFIFPKSIDKEVFSTMPMYYRCFLSMNQPHDP